MGLSLSTKQRSKQRSDCDRRENEQLRRLTLQAGKTPWESTTSDQCLLLLRARSHVYGVAAMLRDRPVATLGSSLAGSLEEFRPSRRSRP